jgi:hypothetical protein
VKLGSKQISYNFIKGLAFDDFGVAYLADALRVVVTCACCGVKNFRADKKIVANLDSQKETRACMKRVT